MYLWRCVKNGLQVFDARLSLGLTTAEEMEDEGIASILQPPVEKEEKPAEPEEEKKPQVSFTKTKEQPAPEPPAEPKKEEEPPEPPESPEGKIEKEKLVEGIKACLKEAHVDEKLFKKWLGEELQPSKRDREFVGLKFNNWSFNEGNLEDLKLLLENIEWSIKKGYLESETFKKEAQKDEPGEEEEEEDPL